MPRLLLILPFAETILRDRFVQRAHRTLSVRLICVTPVSRSDQAFAAEITLNTVISSWSRCGVVDPFA